MADVEFDPWQEAEENMQAGERPGGMGTAAHGEAVRQVVKMFGGRESAWLCSSQSRGKWYK
jgi:hypothetical protein